MKSIYYNKTRNSKSIPLKLIKSGKPYLIPLYYLLLTSHLAKEAIISSGSYKLADHIYQGKAKGDFVIGYFIDLLLLNLKSAKSFRFRYLYAKKELLSLIEKFPANRGEIDILAVPSGLTREFFEVIEELHKKGNEKNSRITWHGIDLDKNLIKLLNQKKLNVPAKMRFHQGDAMNPSTYNQTYDIILSMGFVDFLTDDKALDFFNIVRSRLKRNGYFITSSMIPHKLSDYLLRNIGEINTVYRSHSEIKNLVFRSGFKKIKVHRDKNKLLTMLVVNKN